MLIYVQWALDAAGDWTPIESDAWENLPKKADPTGHELSVDAEEGWICAIQCQGVTFQGYDHYAVEPIEDGVRITGWQDSADNPPGTRWATQFEFLSPAPDPAIGGRVNTRQTRRCFAELDAEVPGKTDRWEDWTPPTSSVIRHGKWQTDVGFRFHQTARTPHGWQEWVT